MNVPLYSSLVRAPLQVPAHPLRYRHGHSVRSSTATKMNKGLEYLFCEDRLRELGPFSLEKTKLGVDL